MTCPSTRHFICCLVLVQHRKTGKCSDMTEKINDWDVKHEKAVYDLVLDVETVFGFCKQLTAHGNYF